MPHITERQHELIQRALDIMEKRANKEDLSRGARCAYNSAIIMIIYALQGNEECLNQFDY